MNYLLRRINKLILQIQRRCRKNGHKYISYGSQPDKYGNQFKRCYYCNVYRNELVKEEKYL